MSITTKMYHEQQKPTIEEKSEIVDFLYEHLENFGDPKGDIEKCINYALKESPSFGGFVLSGYQENKLACVVVVNKTGMKDYIPENILVYIATHKEMRGIGIGKAMMKEALSRAEGNIALHVEPDNPARYLYQKLGFTNKYLEMRFLKS